MDIKIGERILLDKDFFKQIIKSEDMEDSSRSFAITALSDVAVGIKNLRSKKSYTIRIEDFAKHIEEFEPTRDTKKEKIRPKAVIDIPVPNRPVTPTPVTPTPVTPTPVTPTPVTPTPVTPTPVDDPFAGLY